MKLKKITLKPGNTVSTTRDWIPTISTLDDSRNPMSNPNPLGFYIYPATKSDTEALEELKKVMVEAHERQIEHLTMSKEKLLGVRL